MGLILTRVDMVTLADWNLPALIFIKFARITGRLPRAHVQPRRAKQKGRRAFPRPAEIIGRKTTLTD
jgi:hypothetical protein